MQAGDDAKLFVLIESGVRVHLTTYERDKAQVPSQELELLVVNVMMGA